MSIPATRTIYIHKEQSARATALKEHIESFHYPHYIIKDDILPNTIKSNATYDKIDSYLFILNENAIKEYSNEYSYLVKNDKRMYPNREHSKLEISKSYCREFINKIGLGYINPQYYILYNPEKCKSLDYSKKDYINKVIKADGLAGGKGVFVYGDHFQTNEEAIKIVSDLHFKSEHDKIVIEEKLNGEEFSLITLSWKGHVTHFPLIKDFKRLYNDDKGANTGGMGTISFAGGLMPFISSEEYKQCCDINEKVIKELNYKGFLYGSFIKTYSGEIKLIEYNVRLGDSEAVNILGLLDSSLIDYLDDPIKNPLIINRAKYTYFRYLVPSGYPNIRCCSNDNISNSPADSYFVVNPELLLSNRFYRANCSDTKLDNVYKMGKSRTCGIFTMDNNINKVIEENDHYIKMVYGDFHYRTDLGDYFMKNYITKFHTQNITEIDASASASTNTGINAGINAGNANYLNHLNNYNHIITNTKEIIDVINENIETQRPEIKVIGKIGDFANSIQYNGHNGNNGNNGSNGNNAIKLICSVDGAGTKTKFLEGHPERFHILGSDIVVHNINDMYCNNGIPIALLDYYGCDKLDKQQFNQFIEGALTVCSEYGIPLIGGETAEMRGIFASGEIEVLGILLGVVPDSPINGNNITSGNYIYGISSNGAHTNGFTKLREIDTLSMMPGYVKEFFSQPHKCYVGIMDKIINILGSDAVSVMGKVHITGGGFMDNIERILPVDKKKMHIQLDKWELVEEWQWVFDNSGMDWNEFIRVFNAGWGFCFITDREIANSLLENICNLENGTEPGTGPGTGLETNKKSKEQKIKLLGRII
jgi:phosphoribosylaminoimidazole synthetase